MHDCFHSQRCPCVPLRPHKRNPQVNYEVRLKEERLQSFHCMKVLKWSKSKLYCVQNGEFRCVPTNFPHVNHLDLEEHTCSIGGYSILHPDMLYAPMDRVYTIFPFEAVAFSQTNIQRNEIGFIKCTEPFNLIPAPARYAALDYLDLEEYRTIPGDRRTSYRAGPALKLPSSESRLDLHSGSGREYLMLAFEQKIGPIMNSEFEFLTLIELLRCWNSDKFYRLVHYFKRCEARSASPRCVNLSRTKRYIRVLRASCNDPVLVVNYFEGNGSHPNKVKLSELSNRMVNFFARNLKRSGLSHSRRMLLDDADLLMAGFNNEDPQTVRLALDLEWPSALLTSGRSSQYLRWKCDILGFQEWNRTYYFSTWMYYSLITRAVFVLIPDSSPSLEGSHARRKACINVFWRSVPTPYATVAAVEEYDRKCWAPMPAGLAASLWSIVTQCFEKEFRNQCTPRSLQHLSRCAVRRRYRCVEDIRRLPLPCKLKEYLNLEF